MKHLCSNIKSLGTTSLLLLTVLFSAISFADSIDIHHARVNPTIPGMPVTAAYFHIKNNSDQAVQLIEVTGEVSDRIEIHEHTMTNGLMKMQEVTNGITIPAKDTFVLKPGGYHIMVMNLDKRINEGDDIALTLHFNNGSKKKITAKAKNPSASAHPHKPH